MPTRETRLYDYHIYHIYNKSIDSKRIFLSHQNVSRFLNALRYYRCSNAPLRYSNYINLNEERKYEIDQLLLDSNSFYISIMAYCLMPNHFHFLIRQLRDNGISKCISNSINSFTRYYNIKNQRKGPLFLPQFKAVEIVTDEQLKHVSRYIHLNPYSSKIIGSKTELSSYPYSSYGLYLRNKGDSLTDNGFVLNLFNNNSRKYENFVLENADYQESLEHIKHTYKWT